MTLNVLSWTTYRSTGLWVQVGALAMIVLLAGVSCGKRTEKEVAASFLSAGLKAHEEGRLNDAAKEYREVLVHEPTNKFAYYNLGLIDQQKGRKQGAEGNYRQALATDPNFVPALFNLAIILTDDRADEALGLYKRVVELKPDDAGAHLNMGFLLKSMGQLDEGNAELKTAVALNPTLASRIEPEPSQNDGPNPPIESPEPSPTRRY
jgi:tetratricopeptide (TPR) repeat protein